MICGLNLTHDGAVAVIDQGALLFSIEAEKVGNAPRYAGLTGLAQVVDLLRANGVDPSDIDTLAVDGWLAKDDRAEIVVAGTDGSPTRVEVAAYHDLGAGQRDVDLITGREGTLHLAGRERRFRSHLHSVGHLFAAYCTSPWAMRGEPALVLVWDGGMPAVLYAFDPASRRVTNLGVALEASGSVYPMFAATLEPYRASVRSAMPKAGRRSLALGDQPLWGPLLSVSGKAMAYAGLGEVDEAGVATLEALSADGVGFPVPLFWTWRAIKALRAEGLTDASAMASFQEFLYRRLERGLKRLVAQHQLAGGLCFAGGCALNIKFNSRLRASGLFEDVWVPPFPNDAGSAIGTACAEMVRTTEHRAIDWSVFAGPELGSDAAGPGWARRDAGIDEVAQILDEEGTPVVVLAGRAELGPRALGHRSIIAPALDAAMKDTLNDIKGREPYRPVAPICLEERAAEVFDPGTRDPYMLFDHKVRPDWRHRVPAVVHADGTARLQTVGPDNPLLQQLLLAYEGRTGVPVLCNTSANLSGRGFFPDAASAMRWGRTRHVWADGRLYTQSSAEVVQ